VGSGHDEELWICATEMIKGGFWTAGIETEGEFDPSMHFFLQGAIGTLFCQFGFISEFHKEFSIFMYDVKNLRYASK